MNRKVFPDGCCHLSRGTKLHVSWCEPWPVVYQALTGTPLCQCGLEQLLDVADKMELDCLVYTDAGKCPEDLERQTATLFLIGFSPGTLHTQMCLHWQNKDPEEWLCPVLQRHCEGEECVRPGPHPGHQGPHRSRQGWEAPRPHPWAPGSVQSQVALGELGNVFLQGNRRVDSLHGSQVTPFPASTSPMVPSHS